MRIVQPVIFGAHVRYKCRRERERRDPRRLLFLTTFICSLVDVAAGAGRDIAPLGLCCFMGPTPYSRVYHNHIGYEPPRGHV
jgi:hypothetical protein